MEYLNKSEFARMIGVDESLIRRDIKLNRIGVISKGKNKGKINPNTPKNKQYALEIQLSPIAGKTRTTKTKKVFDTSYEIREKINVEGLDLNDVSNLKIRQALANIREKEIKIEHARNKLIDRKYIINVFNSLWSVQQAEFVPIANKTIPEIASILGVEDQEKIALARERLETELWKALGSMKRSIIEFLENE